MAKSPIRSSLVVAVLVLLSLLAFAGVKSYRDLETARRHEAELKREIEAAEEGIRALGERIDLIENDEATLERLAREELGLVKARDVVSVLPEEASP